MMDALPKEHALKGVSQACMKKGQEFSESGIRILDLNFGSKLYYQKVPYL
jgi:hypothetical protein